MELQQSKKAVNYVQVDNEAVVEVVQNTKQRKLYGNLKILTTRPFLVTLGPDYLHFVFAFLCFSGVGYFMIRLVLSATQNIVFRVITLGICIGQPVFYLLTAMTNPGIVTQSIETEEDISEEQRSRISKECKLCNLRVKRKTFHCSDCDVCIDEYDHHCPWVSKCIGKGNIKFFCLFLSSTPVFIIYSMVAFFICAGMSLQQQQNRQA